MEPQLGNRWCTTSEVKKASHWNRHIGIQPNNTWSNSNNMYNPYYSRFRTSVVPASVNIKISCDFTFRDKFSRVNPQLKIASCRYKQFNKHIKCPSRSVQILRLWCSNVWLGSAVVCSSAEPDDWGDPLDYVPLAL